MIKSESESKREGAQSEVKAEIEDKRLKCPNSTVGVSIESNFAAEKQEKKTDELFLQNNLYSLTKSRDHR